MNETNEPKDELERDLGQMRLASASPGLRQRVLDKASEAWAETGPRPQTIVWRAAAIRLGMATAATVALVLLVDGASDRMLAQWDAQSQAEYSSIAHSEVDVPWPMDEQSLAFKVRLAKLVAAQPSADAARKLQSYQKCLREILDVPRGVPPVEPAVGDEPQAEAYSAAELIA